MATDIDLEPSLRPALASQSLVVASCYKPDQKSRLLTAGSGESITEVDVY